MSLINKWFFFIGLSQDFMVDRLISKVRVRITRSRYVANKDKQHHEISVDLLESIYEIGIYKEKHTL